MRTVGWFGWAWLLFAVAACGKTQTAPGASPAAGGSATAGAPGSTPIDVERLVPWQLEAEGTEPLVVGIYDTELGQHCRFVPDSEGQLRCLPLTPGRLNITISFADSACQEPVYTAFLPEGRAVLASLDEPITVPLPADGCEQRYAVGRLRQLPLNAPRYFKSSTGCGPDGSTGIAPDLVASALNFTVTDLTPPERFVSGTEADGTLVRDRVRLREMETPFGTRFPHQLVDEQWQKPCSLSEQSGTLACWPATVSDSNYFTNAECDGQPLYYAPSCTEPAFIGTYQELYALGEPWNGPVFERGKGCREWSLPPSNDRFFTRGELLGADATAAVEWSQAGNGQLALLGLRGDAGERVALGDQQFPWTVLVDGPVQSAPMRYHDNAADLDCAPIWTSQGEVRCVPSTALVNPYTFNMFVDAACSKPAYLCLTAEPCVGRDVIVMDFDDSGNYRAVSRSAALEVPAESLFTLDSAGACVTQPLAGPTSFQSGEALPWDVYPLLDEVNSHRYGP